jgi:hypothetical protein
MACWPDHASKIAAKPALTNPFLLISRLQELPSLDMIAAMVEQGARHASPDVVVDL